MITVKQFANNCPGFDVQFRPFFEDQMLSYMLGLNGDKMDVNAEADEYVDAQSKHLGNMKFRQQSGSKEEQNCISRLQIR